MATCEAWPVEWPCDITGKTADQLDDAAEFASFLLWGLSGRRIGVCDYVEGYWPATTGVCGVVPYMTRSGTWRNGYAGADCCRVLLHHRPVVAVEAVEVDGVPLADDEYDIVRGAWLRRRGECWPAAYGCDDPPIQVAYRAGVAPPPGTAMVVGEVACELLKGWAGEACKLPSRAISVSRQGVTVQLADPQQYVENGLLGLPLADAWITATNPNQLVMPSRVYSPDLPRSMTAPAPVLLRQVVIRNAVAAGWVGDWDAYTLEAGTKGVNVPVTATPTGGDVHLTLRLPLADVEWVVTHDGQIITGGVA